MREKFRVWAETLETFFLEVVIFEERHDFRAKLTRTVLFGGSKVFQIAVKIRRWLYNVRILRDKTLGVQVIAIGNLTVGGTGKTPVVEKFARELRDAGRNVAILSRGYRSKPPPFHIWLLNKILLRGDQTPPRVVSDGKSLLLDSDTAGDEPYMLASNLQATSSCSWTRTASKAGVMRSKNSAATPCCSTTAFNTGICADAGTMSC